MGRKAYTIKTDEDYMLAKSVIERSMTDGRIDKASGYNQYRNAVTPMELQSWCDDYLNQDQWRKLKQNIRKAKEKETDRTRPRSERPREVTIKQSGHDVLKEIADKTNLSYNEIILKYLEPLTCGGKVYDHEGKRLYLLKE